MQKIVDKLFEKGKAKGFTQQEVFYSSTKTTSVKVYEGEVENMDASVSSGMSYRAMIDGKLGYCYTEQPDESSIDMLVNEAFANAKVIESKDEVFIFGEKCNYDEVELFNAKIDEIPFNEKIKIPMEIERKIKQIEPRTVNVTYNSYQETENEMFIKNTNGLMLSSKRNGAVCYCMPIIKDGDETKTGFYGNIIKDFSELDTDYIAKKAVEKATKQFGASSHSSGIIDIVFDKEGLSSLMQMYLSVLLSAERVQQNMSLLEGKIGEQIATSSLTIIDDPHIKFGVASGSFDAEGFPTSPKNIVENGKLMTFYHNLKTAHKDGIKSTGNAQKSSYKGLISVSPSNTVIKAGDKTREQIIEGCEKAIYISSLEGLHAGVNFSSGDFSLKAEGILIEDGKLTRPINQIVLSGNFLDLLNNIVEIGNDVGNTIFAPTTYIPTIKVKGLTISGE